MIEQENIVIRDLTDDELQLIGGGITGLFSALIKSLVDQGPLGAAVAIGVVAASAYFE